MTDKISIKGAREHNLKNIDVEIPRDKLVVVTGVSGSGKSSLAFDTIFAEGQRRYIESLSSYARQFLGQMDKPDVDVIEGLSPAISIDQKTTSKNPRSTVGTVTEIYDYLRLLYANIGVAHCPVCGRVIEQQSVDQIVDRILAYPEGTKLMILAPIVRNRKGEHQKLLEAAAKAGFVRVRVDGIMYDLGENIPLDKNVKHKIDLVVDRVIVREEVKGRITDSVETALRMGEGLVSASTDEGEVLFSQNYSCPDHEQVTLEELTPRMFSFNNPYGACEKCSGLGVFMRLDPDLIIPDKELSIAEGAIKASGWNYTANSICKMYFNGVAKHYGFSLDTPVKDLPRFALNALLYGTGGERIVIERINEYGSGTYLSEFEGVINNLERRYRETQSEWSRAEIESVMSPIPCDSCGGARLKPEILAVTVGGKNIYELTSLSIERELEFFEGLQLTERELTIAGQIIKEIKSRLGFLKNVGLGYITLARGAATLSGGENQRIRLATQIGSSLMGVLYILDEPSIGLHQRDNRKLLAALQRLRDLGNTLIVVEHDEETMREADMIIDIGPGAGANGGHLVAQGTAEEICACEESITGQYLSGKKRIPVPKQRRKGTGEKLTVVGARENNLKNINVDIPLGVFTCVTGVSGSGKSSLINEILYKRLSAEYNRTKQKGGKCDDILGREHLNKVINIDQDPIGRMPSSNPATYTGVFNDIRALFAETTGAKERGFNAGRFSFNVRGGRCEACEGNGIVKIEMHFLPDVYVPCDVCKGKRYNRETLAVKYKDKSIHDVLEMTVDEALAFFDNLPKIKRKLQVLSDVGLGYIKLGQPATTLSGGEAQRVKLATELAKRATGKTIYFLDEPSTGLHTADVKKLVEVLQRLVDAGNTVVVIEHNLDIIKSADYIIDLGPEGGEEGGELVACGTPEQVARTKGSFTGEYLKDILFGGKKNG